jgi:hypothetical protein
MYERDCYVSHLCFSTLGLDPVVGFVYDLNVGVPGVRPADSFSAFANPMAVTAVYEMCRLDNFCPSRGCVVVRVLPSLWDEVAGNDELLCTKVEVVGTMTGLEIRAIADSAEPVRLVSLDGTVHWLLHGEKHCEDGPAEVSADGTEQKWFRHGKLHREELDGPAVITSTEQIWMKEGKRHRTDGQPAYISTCGKAEFWENGVLHRAGGSPAIIIENDRLIHREWWENGECHREGNQPANESRDPDGTVEAVEYCVRNKMHRTDGPALVYKGLGVEEWYIEGEFHRDDGPAYVRTDRPTPGSVLKKWFQHGVLHRGNDEPAVEETVPGYKVEQMWYTKGMLTKRVTKDVVKGIQFTKWYEDGVLHRTLAEPPSVTLPNGDIVFYTDMDVIGRLDENEPSVITADKTRKWYRNGTLGRVHDLPDVEYADHLEWHDGHGVLIRTYPPWHRKAIVTPSLRVLKL